MVDVVPAEVIQVMGKLGVKGVTRVRCKVIEGRDSNKILTRNVIGPIRKGDVIMLRDSAMDSVSRFQKK